MSVFLAYFRYDDEKADAAEKERLVEPPKYTEVVPKPRKARRKVADKTYDEYSKEPTKFGADGAPLDKSKSPSTTDV